MPASDHTVTVNYEQSCLLLIRDHTGSGSSPAVNPASSTGCSTGRFHSGEQIQLTASPDSGWQVGSWNGTSNNASTSTSNSVTMPASDHNVTVNYVQSCFLLTRTHTGSGSNPTANPTSSSGCSTGTYHSGEQIQLTASPSPGWQVGGWTTGTSNDGSSSLTNSLVMPLGPHATAVHYVEIIVIPNDLVLSNDTISQPTLYEACNSITLGPGLFITAGAPGVTLRAPTILIVPESAVLSGALATFDHAAPAGCP